VWAEAPRIPKSHTGFRCGDRLRAALFEEKGNSGVKEVISVTFVNNLDRYTS
jgi:hypothetical protein